MNQTRLSSHIALPILVFTIGLLAGCSTLQAQEVTPTAIAMPESTATATVTVVATSEPITAEPVPSPTVTQVAEVLLPAIDCSSPALPTVSMTEGPYYKAGSPERSSLLEPGMSGTRLVITGYVLNTDCQPIPGAWLDFWQTDAEGNYDNAGFRLRGHQFSDANGRYTLETVLPGLYPGRTAHIHLKVQAPNGPVLTSQLFFPGVSGNQTDRIFDESLLVMVEQDGESLAGSFNFVIPTR